MKSKKLIKFKLLLVLLVAISHLKIYSQGTLDFKWHIGFTTFSYFNQEYYFPQQSNVFLSSLITAPTIGLKIFYPKLNLGFEQTYYNAFVPSTDFIYDMSFAKQGFTIGPYYVLAKHYKFSLFYSVQDYNNLQKLPSLVGAPISIRRGIGSAFGYQFNNDCIEIRKELIRTFSDGTRQSRASPLTEHWTLRVAKDMSFRREEGFTDEKYLFKLVFGLTTSGSVISSIAKIAPFKVFPTIGIETARIKNTSLYLRRGQWYHWDVRDAVNLKLTSQINYVGTSYKFNLKNKDNVILGLHHVWNATRGLQFLVNIGTNTIPEENLWFIYNNKGIGLDIRYRMENSNFDFVLNTDFYYETRDDFTAGFNSESLRLGILYNL